MQRAAYANLGLSVLGPIFGDGAGARIGQVAAEMATAGTFMRFTRDAERETDRLGAANVAAEGHDPRGMLTFFEKLGALRDRPGECRRTVFSHRIPSQRSGLPTSRICSVRWATMAALWPIAVMPRRTESFASVTRHLATLLPPPEVPESVVSASGADSDRSAAPNGSTPETKRIDPSPVTYRELTRTTRSPRASRRYSTRCSVRVFDSTTSRGLTLTGTDEGITTGTTRTIRRVASRRPSVFNVSETVTHYFIHYAVFHPRDYKGGNVRGVILSEIMRKGSTRHGDYDPTGLSQSAVLAHENDMEGALVVVENASGLFGSTRVSHVETLRP